MKLIILYKKINELIKLISIQAKSKRHAFMLYIMVQVNNVAWKFTLSFDV